MSFIPRTFEEIRDNALDFIRLQTDLTDLEVGSVVRTIVEAFALEDDEQYFQMVQLLDAFRLSTATGQELDARVAEYGIIRLQPGSSAGDLFITDGLLTTSSLAFDPVTNPGAGSIILEDSSKFPTAGFPVTVRIGEGTINVEDVSVTANTVGTGTLTLAGVTVNAHNAGERVSLVDGVADQTLDVGIRAQVPAADGNAAIVFITIEEGVIVNGNFLSTSIDSRAELPGRNGNVGAGQIIEFASSPPFDAAGVTNRSSFGSGRDLETDADLRDRARDQIQSLSKGTVLALQQSVIGVVDLTTGQRVVTSSVFESFADDEVIVYIDDGTGFAPDLIELARTALSVAVAVPVGSLTVVDSSEYPQEGFLVVSPEDPAQTEILEFSGVAAGTITLVGVTANLHDIGDETSLIDLVEASAEPGANFFRLAQFPIVDGSLRLWLDEGGGPVGQLEGTDFVFNPGTGEIEFIGGGVVAGSVIAANYDYYTGLVSTAQKVINGDPDDPVNFPGVRCAGSKVRVDTPVIRQITAKLAITAREGFNEADIAPQVQEAIEAYINGLGIGDDVIVAEIIERAMAVTGMFNVVATLPASDLVILENELPVPFNSSGDSLITVN